MSMRGGRFAAVVGILVVWAAAGSCDRGLPHFTFSGHTLSGTVRDARTGTALAGAKLMYAYITTISGDRGEYRFTDLGRGWITLTARREGYWDFRADVEIGSEDLRYDVEMQPR